MLSPRQYWQALKQRFRRPPRSPAIESSKASPRDATPGSPDLQADLDALQSGLNRLERHEEQQIASLQQRVDRLETERNNAQYEIAELKQALTDAVSRQEKAEARASTLENRLRDLSDQQQAERQAALIRERRQARRLNLAMVIAFAAFLLGSALSVTTYRLADNSARLLAGIDRGVRDIHAAIERQQANTLDKEATMPHSRANSEAPPAAPPRTPLPDPEKAPSKAAAVTQLPAAPTLPDPDFLATGSLPLAGHTFSSRQDTRSFFRENARQPGVVTLQSGLQYRVLIPGDGRIPGPSDTVEIEYRAFRPDGTELDNSFRETQPSIFVVSDATPGLEETLQQMQTGAQWELYIPPALVSDGVRKRGRFGFEPLILTVELLSVTVAEAPEREH